MKMDVKPEKLKLLVLGAGGLGLLLRIWLYATGLDEKGLLQTGHFAHVMVWVLAVVVPAAVVLLTRSYQGPRDNARAFPASVANAAGSVLLAAVILMISIQKGFEMTDMLGVLHGVLGYAAVAALAATGMARLLGNRSNFLFYVVLCLYFVVSLVQDYRQWSADPQLLDYAFRLLAGVSLVMTAYHRGSFEVQMGRHNLLWLYSLLAVFFCCLSVDVSVGGCYYLAAGVWSYTGLSELREKQRRSRPVLNLEEE